MSTLSSKKLFLFDIDGTLTKSRQMIEPKMFNLLQKLSEVHHVGLIGGSDWGKIDQQMNNSKIFEGGLVCHSYEQQIYRVLISDILGEKLIQEIINFSLMKLSQIVLPIKRGNFVEYRCGLINISPIGRSCSQTEREEFVEYDKIHKIRDNMVNALRERFSRDKVSFSIGGQISIDVFATGCDKSYSLKELSKYDFDQIFFFGDRVEKGGNDHELFIHEKITGIAVTSPQDTFEKVSGLII